MKTIYEQEIEHRLQNWKFFGYDEKPAWQQVAEDVFNSKEIDKLYQQ